MHGSPRFVRAVKDQGKVPLETYRSVGTARGLSWSPNAAAVLEMLWKCDVPMGAYAIRDRLSKERPFNVNSVYRALSRLVDASLVLSIATTRKFLISRDPLEQDWLILICSTCGHIETMLVPSTFARLKEESKRLHFTVRRIHVEVLAPRLPRATSCGAPSAQQGSANG